MFFVFVVLFFGVKLRYCFKASWVELCTEDLRKMYFIVTALPVSFAKAPLIIDEFGVFGFGFCLTVDIMITFAHNRTS